MRSRERFNRICSTVLTGSLLAGMLLGCAQKDRVRGNPGEPGAVPGDVSGTVRGASSAEPLQSTSERQLVIVFISLLEMDKRVELQISRQQAERILPVVNATIAHGELSQADRKLLLAALDARQQSYYEDVSARMKRRAAAMSRSPGPPPGPPLTEEQRAAIARELEERRSQEVHGNGDGAGQEPRPTRFGEPPPWDLDRDKNVEQQLVELLRSKLDAASFNS